MTRKPTKAWVYIPIWTIKDGGFCTASRAGNSFTFQYGRLKTGHEQLIGVLLLMFTFQYGRLKTHAYESLPP